MHSRVCCKLNPDAPSLGGKLARVRFVHYGLGQPPANEEARLGRRRVAEDQDSAAYKRFAQRNSLAERCDGK